MDNLLLSKLNGMLVRKSAIGVIAMSVFWRKSHFSFIYSHNGSPVNHLNGILLTQVDEFQFLKLVRALKQVIYRFFLQLAHEETGQSTVEYILILSVCVLGASQLSRRLINALDQGVLRIGSQLEQDIKTGRAPLGVWKN